MDSVTVLHSLSHKVEISERSKNAKTVQLSINVVIWIYQRFFYINLVFIIFSTCFKIELWTLNSLTCGFWNVRSFQLYGTRYTCLGVAQWDTENETDQWGGVCMICGMYRWLCMRWACTLHSICWWWWWRCRCRSSLSQMWTDPAGSLYTPSAALRRYHLHPHRPRSNRTQAHHLHSLILQQKRTLILYYKLALIAFK